MREAQVTHEEFARLWKRHYPKLLSSCLSWTRGRRDLAEEVLSRSTEKALEGYPAKAEDLRHPEAWLRKITYHAFVDYHREVQRRGEGSLEELPEEVSIYQALGVGSPDPERSLLEREQSQALRVVVHRLPERLRQPMELFLYQDLTHREIADVLSITEANVRKRLQHAREELKPHLERYREGTWTSALPTAFPDTREVVSLQVSGTRTRRGDPSEVGLPPGLGPEPVTAVRVFAVHRSGGALKDVTLVFRQPLRSATRSRFERLESYIRAHPGGWKKRRELGRLLRQEGRWSEAVPHYRFALTKQPRQPDLWGELGDVLRALGRGDQALDCYRIARQRARSGVARRRWRASILTTEGQLPEAVEVLRDALDVSPGSVLLRLEMARLLFLTRRFPQADKTLSEVLEELPGDPEALVLSHDARFADGDLPGALRRLERSLATPIDNPPALVRWLVHQTLGRIPTDPGRAQSYRERLRELAKDWADRRYAEALEVELAGRSQGTDGCGVWEMKGWLKERGGHARGHLLLARLLERIGASNHAERARARGFEADPEDRIIGWL